MPEVINLDRPSLGIQYERQRVDPYIRAMRSLRNYAKVNGFDHKLDKILKQVGGKELLSMDYTSKPKNLRDRAARSKMLPKIKMALRHAGIQLSNDLKKSRKGVNPVVPKKYKFKTESGATGNFELDPTQKGRDVLTDFENAIDDMFYADKIKAEFIPTFRKIKGIMVRKWGWDANEAAANATMVTIQTLADKWMK